MKDKSISRPELTLPPDEAKAVINAYGAASVILEYGSGGSTVLAAEMPGKVVFSVESSAEWLAGMQGYFALNPPLATVYLHHGDIGPTKEWGKPVNEKHIRQWPGYPLSVWDLPDFSHPDLVLIDGRFRAACFLTCLFKSTKPMTVLWDDYAERKFYHRVEELVKPVEMIGRMARFEIAPMAVPVDRLPWILDIYLRQN